MLNDADNSHEYQTADNKLNDVIRDNPGFVDSFIQKHFTFRNTLTLTLVLINIILLIKVDFFLPLISGKTPLHDFDSYYRLIADLIKGNNPYEVSYMRTWGPPLVFLYYLPFHLVELPTARMLTTSINIASGIATLLLLTKYLFISRKLTAFIGMSFLLFSSFPGRFSLEMGQPNMVLMLLITLIMFSNKLNIKSILLGTLAALKTYFLLTFFTFLKSEKRIFMKSLLAIFLIAFFVSLLIKPSLYLYYYQNVLPQLLSSGSQISQVDYYNQTYFSTLARVGVSFPDKSFYALATIVGVYLIYIVGNFEIAVILSLILSIVSWQHYFVVLFPVYIKALTDSPKNFYDYVFVSILIGFWWIEFPWLHHSHLSTFNGLLASHYFLSALLLAIYILLIKSRFSLKKF